MKVSLLFIGLLLCAGSALAVNWAVLIAGSAEFYNYRHQSDIAHAYQILKRGGFDDDHIIVMAKGDVVFDSENPFPNQVFNHPTPAGVPGINVFDNILIDYFNNDVTADNFIGVLTGNSTATKGKPVLESGPEDNVFVYYSDHGAVGSVAMPTGPVLTVNRLQDAFKTMVQKNMFGKMVFYLEACESGSMMEGLSSHSNIMALTASNAEESSYAIYCPPHDSFVDGTNLVTCLGDEFSVNWMEYVDTVGVESTLHEHYLHIKNATVESHVLRFGDVSFINMHLSDFLVQKGAQIPAPIGNKNRNALKSDRPASKIDSRDVKLDYFYRRYMDKTRSFEQQYEEGYKLLQELQHRLDADLIFNTLATSILGNADAIKAHTAPLPLAANKCGKCCDEAYAAIAEYPKCNFSDYSLKYGRTLHAMCTYTGKDVTEAVVKNIHTICGN